MEHIKLIFIKITPSSEIGIINSLLKLTQVKSVFDYLVKATNV